MQSSGGGGIDNRINEAFVALLEAGPKPTVAAISGMALGGGLEAALACNARVATPEASLGLPELQLGIIPGFGGTQRLPRVVGLTQAIKMMLTSAPVKANVGKKLGLIDVLVPQPEDLLPTAKRVALDIADGRAPRRMSLFRTDKIEPMGEALQIIEFARAQVAKQARGLRHPQLCLDAIQAGVEHGGLAGIKAEGAAFAAAAALDTHKALVHIFFAIRSTKKIKGVTDKNLKPRRIQTVAVLGGGLMGSGIATACILAGMNVLLKEVNSTFLQGGMERIKGNLASRVKKGRMTGGAATECMTRVQGVLDYSEFKTVDMVIEAVIEDIKLKQTIFQDLARACRPDAILSTNTSTIDVELIGAKIPDSLDRLIGAHFFSPAHIMPLLEIVRTQHTAPQVILDTLEFGSRMKKTPVVVGNCTGFAVNRVFFPYTQAACMLADMGPHMDPYMIDKAIAGFGMPMGPFRLSDLVGADVGLHVGKNFLESFHERSYPASIIAALNDTKRLGEKTGAGFYKYDARRKASPDPQGVAPLLEASRGVAPFAGKPLPEGIIGKENPVKDIVEFIFFPVVNEACRVIEEGIVDKPADLDVATVMAMGFPAPKGGLIFWADLVGAKYVADRLKDWAEKLRPYGLNGFFEPCHYLKRVAESGGKLGAGVASSSRL